jgi:A/G-specific adenine glycosylase
MGLSIRDYASVTPRQRKINASVASLLDWYARNARDLPWRRNPSAYGAWISEIMLQQTQVKTVVPYWERWMRALPDVGAVARAGPQRLHKLWEGLGYYTRVRNLQQAARVIQEQYRGRFPEEFDRVLALPGVGRYTAGAICSMAYDQPRPALDGNVMRVLARLFGVAGDPRKNPANARLWGLAQELADQASRGPAGSCSRLSQSLMELGALVCSPRQPRCGACPVAGPCVARRQGRVEELPGRALAPRTTARRFVAFVIWRRGRLLVRQRPAGVVNAHLWELPNVEAPPGKAGLERAARKVFGRDRARLEPLCVVRHSITRYRMTLEAFVAQGSCGEGGGGSSGPRPRRAESALGPGAARRLEGRWLSPRQLARRPFASAHRRVLEAWNSRNSRNFPKLPGISRNFSGLPGILLPGRGRVIN